MRAREGRKGEQEKDGSESKRRTVEALPHGLHANAIVCDFTYLY